MGLAARRIFSAWAAAREASAIERGRAYFGFSSLAFCLFLCRGIILYATGLGAAIGAGGAAAGAARAAGAADPICWLCWMLWPLAWLLLAVRCFVGAPAGLRPAWAARARPPAAWVARHTEAVRGGGPARSTRRGRIYDGFLALGSYACMYAGGLRNADVFVLCGAGEYGQAAWAAAEAAVWLGCARACSRATADADAGLADRGLAEAGLLSFEHSAACAGRLVPAAAGFLGISVGAAFGAVLIEAKLRLQAADARAEATRRAEEALSRAAADAMAKAAADERSQAAADAMSRAAAADAKAKAVADARSEAVEAARRAEEVRLQAAADAMAKAAADAMAEAAASARRAEEAQSLAADVRAEAARWAADVRSRAAADARSEAAEAAWRAADAAAVAVERSEAADDARSPAAVRQQRISEAASLRDAPSAQTLPAEEDAPPPRDDGPRPAAPPVPLAATAPPDSPKAVSPAPASGGEGTEPAAWAAEEFAWAAREAQEAADAEYARRLAGADAAAAAAVRDWRRASGAAPEARHVSPRAFEEQARWVSAEQERRLGENTHPATWAARAADLAAAEVRRRAAQAETERAAPAPRPAAARAAIRGAAPAAGAAASAFAAAAQASAGSPVGAVAVAFGGSAAQRRKRCKYGAICSRGNCWFAHPAAAPAGAAPLRGCKYGRKCKRRATCPFAHAPGGEPPAAAGVAGAAAAARCVGGDCRLPSCACGRGAAGDSAPGLRAQVERYLAEAGLSRALFADALEREEVDRTAALHAKFEDFCEVPLPASAAAKLVVWQLTAAAQPALSSDYGDGDYDDDCGDDDDDSGGLCIICMAAPKAVAFVPCGHVCACLVCFRKFAGAGITNCPICREPIAGSTPLEPRSAA